MTNIELSGEVHVEARIGRLAVDAHGPTFARPPRTALFLVDTGSSYVGLPRTVIEELELHRSHEEQFDEPGGTVQRQVYLALLEYQGRRLPVFVVETEAMYLIGVVVLESFGLRVNPLTRGLEPARPRG